MDDAFFVAQSTVKSSDLMTKLVTIRVSGGSLSSSGSDRWTNVSWFPGSSCESIEIALKLALDIPADAMIKCSDTGGCVLALTEAVPNGTEVRVEIIGETVFAPAPAPESQPLLNSGKTTQAVGTSRDSDSLSSPSSSGDDGFRTQLLKFERINAHLANERTWLAWVRTALSLISCGFTFLNEASDNSSFAWRVTYFILGTLFLCCVDLTWMTGWFRYRRNKDILSMPKDSLPRKFNRFRMRFQAQFLGILLLSTLVVYISSGWTRI